ncbi:hypothetical protein ACP275_02G082800 [Erythranthe tilingii]
MYGRGASFEIEAAAADDRSAALPRRELNEMERSWLLRPVEHKTTKKHNTIFLWMIGAILAAGLATALISSMVKNLRRHRHHHQPPLPLDNYTLALNKALMFFNAQRSGRLPEDNNVSWRGDSCLKDGSSLSEDLSGGYYDSGDAIKFNFPQSFAMTLLSWSVVEYSAKYEAAGELNHVKETIKWGTDYLLKTFNHSADTIDRVVTQVGRGGYPSGTDPNDHSCWMRPEDIDYERPVTECHRCSDLAAEMAAALASASIVFKDSVTYSHQLIRGAETLFHFSRERRGLYSIENQAASFYNSTSYWDEFVWGATWLYYATGNISYLELATAPALATRAGAFERSLYDRVFSWDNKLPGAQVLLTRLRIFLSPGYPYEEILNEFHKQVELSMCSFLPNYTSFNRTRGGMIDLSQGQPRNLQYVVNAAFLAQLFGDYLSASDTGGWYCGPDFYTRVALRQFSEKQIGYILGANPRNMSYVVGFGDHYPKHVHHRGASIPNDNIKYSCTGGWRWRNSKKSNPNTIVGAMVAGPYKHDDGFEDLRENYNYTEPAITGNAGLVAALVALSGKESSGIDRNTMFSAVPPMYPAEPPPPAPWKP